MDYRFGPRVEGDGVLFRVWAPKQPVVELLLPNEPPRPMVKAPDGMWSLKVKGLGEGARYKFHADSTEFPDLASREQAGDARGWSVVRKPIEAPRNPEPLRPWHETIICEVHVGTVTPEGTFSALAKRLEHFRDAGYTALELMPINTFSGARNWGYDGTLIFAPHRSYGTREELRALVDRAHELGLCMILDVVYNHFGSVDNFVPKYAPEWFNKKVKTPWGPAIDMEQPLVRQFYYENLCMWLSEFDFDGVRFDAINEIKGEGSELFLRGLAKAARTVKPEAKLIVENPKNQPHLLGRDNNGEPIQFTAQWNDDYHHVLEFLVSGEPKNGYTDGKRDPIEDLQKVLMDGFTHDGKGGEADAEPSSQLPMEAFVAYSQNHDQIGNRADGKRLADRVDEKRLDFLRFVTLLNPQLPLMFMGEEAELRCGFPFFFDLPEVPAKEKAADRYRQMKEIFKEDVQPGQLPDPNAVETFMQAKLDWSEYNEPERKRALERFRELCNHRRKLVWPLTASPCNDARAERRGDGVIVTWDYKAGLYSMALNPTDAPIELRVSLNEEQLCSCGSHTLQGEVLRLEAWSGVAWADSPTVS